MSGRRYKKDLSDIIGILSEQERMGESLSYQQIDCAKSERKQFGCDYPKSFKEKGWKGCEIDQKTIENNIVVREKTDSSCHRGKALPA